MSTSALGAVVKRPIDNSHSPNVPDHEVGGEGVLGNEEDRTCRVDVQVNADLPLWSVVDLGEEEGESGWLATYHVTLPTTAPILLPFQECMPTT